MNQAAEIIPFQTSEVELYSEFTAQLAKLKDDNAKAVFDYASPKGNKEARSHIFTLRKVKGALEQARKDAKARALEYGRLVDSKAKEICAELESMIDLHEKPLVAIEEKEKERVATIQARIQSLDFYKTLSPAVDAATLQAELQSIQSFVLDDSLMEFLPVAAIAKDAALIEVRARLEARAKYEQEQAELAKFRAESEARAKQEREAKIAQEAAEKATRDAEEKAKQQRIAAEREQQERDRQAAERERQAELAIAQAKQREAEAVARAARAEQDAREKAAREHEARVAADRAAEEKRENDKKHKAKINNEALQGLRAAGLTEDQGKDVIAAIATGQVPNIRIQY